MKKLGKRLLILVGIIGGLYVFYLLFITPNGFTTEQAVVESYILNLNDESCSEHFYNDTTEICETFNDIMDGHEVTIDTQRRTSQGYEVTLDVDGTIIPFTFIMYEYTPSGLRSFLNSSYYKIESVY